MCVESAGGYGGLEAKRETFVCVKVVILSQLIPSPPHQQKQQAKPNSIFLQGV